MREAVATAGLSSLLLELQPRDRASSEPNASGAQSSQSSGLGLVVLIHVATILLGVLAAVYVGDSKRWANESLLIGGDVPGRIVAVGAIFALCILATSLLALVDSQLHLGTSIAILGATMALQCVSVGLGAALSVLAALAMDEVSFWLVFAAFTGACITMGTQAGAIISTLIKQSPLASAIARAL